MVKPLATLLLLALLGGSLSGCSKCGFFWEEGGHACHSETVH